MALIRTNVLACLAAWAVAVTMCCADTPPPDEDGLWLVWTSQTNSVVDHAAAAQVCQAFSVKPTAGSLAVVGQGLAAWHLLKAGKTAEAARLLEPMAALAGDPLANAAAEMAKSWLTRLDRELVRAALKRCYARDIQFPLTLEAIKSLKGGTPQPMTDRWGHPWSYQATELATIKGTPQQRYDLESIQLGANSDLARALEVPYASRITIEPVRALGSGDNETIEFVSLAQKRGVLMAGGEMEGVTFAFVGKTIIVLADKDHWRVAPKPK